jgi:hypothetical protein
MSTSAKVRIGSFRQKLCKSGMRTSMGSSWRKIATHSSRSCRHSRFFLNLPSLKVSTLRLAVAWWWRASS